MSATKTRPHSVELEISQHILQLDLLGRQWWQAGGKRLVEQVDDVCTVRDISVVPGQVDDVAHLGSVRARVERRSTTPLYFLVYRGVGFRSLLCLND